MVIEMRKSRLLSTAPGPPSHPGWSFEEFQFPDAAHLALRCATVDVFHAPRTAPRFSTACLSNMGGSGERPLTSRVEHHAQRRKSGNRGRGRVAGLPRPRLNLARGACPFIQHVHDPGKDPFALRGGPETAAPRPSAGYIQNVNDPGNDPVALRGGPETSLARPRALLYTKC